jgi:hypothetical protein
MSIGASERATWMTTGCPASRDAPLSTRYVVDPSCADSICPDACDARRAASSIGYHAADVVRDSTRPSGLQTVSHGLSRCPGSPSNQVNEPSGRCSHISEAQLKSLRTRSSRAIDALRRTNMNTPAA